MKRYAIVRVDGSCPFVVEDIEHKDCKKIFNCDEFWNDEPCSKNCRYGDTKEQLIRKIETAVAIMRNKMENKEVYLDRAVATFIVEFLGVE